ncbi:MAG: GHKL domain-containing protein [candidate division Zixibacteria bacterium]|nr:GHKL domain-containing protein [candidate division Zixibacteria bacterium]
MIYKNFRINCIIRVTVLAISIFFFFYLVLHTSLYVTGFIVGLIIILQVFSLIYFVEKTNRDLSRFLASIKYSDFSHSFSQSLKGKTFAALKEAFTEVVSEFHRARSEKEEQYRYLQTVVQHIGLGILSFDQEGEVDLINTAAKRLLKINYLKNINSLAVTARPLYETLYNLVPGEKVLVRFDVDGESMTLSIYPTEFKMRQRSITLVSMQNIESELAEQEMAAWQKLIRVLTHEIMNSVTPIASLASTINEMMGETELSPDSGKVSMRSEVKTDIRDAVATIEKRSQGLLHFIDAYRSLTRIPVPNFQIFPVSEIFNRVVPLMKEQLDSNGIQLTINIEPDSLELTADPDLIEQVLINLIMNAIQALRNRDDGEIELQSRLNEHDRVIIAVTDNGPGIPEDIRDRIFTPFYTTKKTGSGIGLSLSRQIMRLHKGNITFQSVPDEKTTFIMRF